LQGLASQGLHLRELSSSDIEDSDRVEVKAAMAADGKSETAVEQIVGRLSLEPSVTGASWRSEAVPE
jgi:putative Mg2+ transporter-C (MgtC) family protein